MIYLLWSAESTWKREYDAMADIHDEVMTRIYREYKEALHSSEKSETLEKGVQDILLDLKRYTQNP